MINIPVIRLQSAVVKVILVVRSATKVGTMVTGDCRMLRGVISRELVGGSKDVMTSRRPVSVSRPELGLVWCTLVF